MIDLSVEMAGVKFKNPVLAAPCDLTCDLRGIQKCIEAGAGGIVMKGLSVQAYSRTRTLPYYISFERFGRGYQTGQWCSPEGFSVDEPETWLKEMGPKAIKLCHDNGVPFIAQLAIQIGDDMSQLLTLARKLEGLGADMLQILQFQCPNDPNLPKSWVEVWCDNIKAVKGVISIPLMDKINVSWPTLCPELIVASEKSGVSAITLWTGSTGVFVDVEKEEFFGVPAINAYMHGRAWVPETIGRIIEARQLVKVPLSSSSGIWDWSDAVSYLLVGASTVQICTTAYFKGRKIFGEVAKGIEAWMKRKGYNSVDEFCGKLLPRVRLLANLCPEVYPLPSPVTPQIDYDLCNLCGICLNGCIYGGIDRVDKEQGKVVLNKQLCRGCGMCISRCPKTAIKLVDKSGNVYWDGHGEAKHWLAAKKA